MTPPQRVSYTRDLSRDRTLLPGLLKLSPFSSQSHGPDGELRLMVHDIVTTQIPGVSVLQCSNVPLCP